MKHFCIRLFLLVVSVFAIGAQAQVTSFSLTGDPGDFILGGQSKFLTPADGTFFVNGSSGSGVVSMTFFGGTEFWDANFAAPNGQPLTVGSYTGTARYPFQDPSQPGLDVSGDGAGCNTSTGSFNVLEISYGVDGNIASFDATFEQHCEGETPALRGEFRFNAHPNLFLTLPAKLTAIVNHNVNFTVTATDSQFRHVVLTATGVPTGAAFIDNGDNTGTFNWTPASTGSFFVTFHGDNLSGDTVTAVTQIVVIPPPPPNDDFNNPTVIPSMPFTVTEDVTTATTAPDDPFCAGNSQSVWFAFTPTQNMRIEANTDGSNYHTTVSVYTGTRGSLTLRACNVDSPTGGQTRVRFDAVAGTTYYIMVASFIFPAPSANLVFNLLPAPPPLSITPSVNQFGSVDPSSGAATISGSVSCSKPAFVTIFGQLRQAHGNSATTGFFSAFVPCDGTAVWSTNIQTLGQTFHGRALADVFTGGPADVIASASAFDFEEGIFVQRNFAVTVKLRGK